NAAAYSRISSVAATDAPAIDGRRGLPRGGRLAMARQQRWLVPGVLVVVAVLAACAPQASPPAAPAAPAPPAAAVAPAAPPTAAAARAVPDAPLSPPLAVSVGLLR